MLTNKSCIYPSMTSIHYSIYKFLANHPLLNRELVIDPITEEPVNINQYRLMGGFPVNEGLTCSIYPLFESEDISSLSKASSGTVSIMYESYDLGGNTDLAKYHFIIEYSHRGVNVDGLNEITEPALTEIPVEHLLYPYELGPLTSQTKKATLYINPSLDIVSNYLELTRLALCDNFHHSNFSFGEDYRGTLDKVTPIYMNFPSINWEKSTSVIDCKGYLLIRLDSYVTRDWRRLWNFPLKEIRYSIDSDK